MTGLLIVGLIAFIAAAAAYYFLVLSRADVYDRALALAERGEYTDARGLIRSKIDRNADDYRAHFNIAKIYALEGNEDAELHHLSELKRINRFTPEMSPITVMNRMGLLLYSQERYRESFEAYLGALAVAPNNEEALVYLAFMAIGQREFEVADPYFKRLVDLSPNVSEYHVARGVGLGMLKSTDSLRELEMGLALSPHDITARFLAALQAFRQPDLEKAVEHIEALMPTLTDPAISHMANRLACGIYYLTKDYDKALTHSERYLKSSIDEGWDQEETDARLTISYMSMLTGDLEKASENLMQLEISNPSDQTIITVSNFRDDLEENHTTIDRVSPKGFDFFSHMQDWLRKRFSEDSLFTLSGLGMEETFDVSSILTKDQGGPKKREKADSGPSLDFDELIEKFNQLKGNAFKSACESIIAYEGFTIEKALPYRDKDGADYIARDQADKKKRALFRIRQWANQPISDIFLRDMQNQLNENKVSLGYIVAGTRLTSGAEAAVQNLKNIKVINEMSLGEVLERVLQ